MRRALPLAVILVAASCVRSPATHSPASIDAWTVRDWPAALASAQQAAVDGRFTAADRELAAFAERNPGTLPARETYYWRAVFLLDPANDTRDPGAAAILLEQYLADTADVTVHRTEASVLHRLAMSLDSLKRVALALPDSMPRGTTQTTSRDREADLARQNQQLREQLERTNAELERIKRRLADRPE